MKMPDENICLFSGSTQKCILFVRMNDAKDCNKELLSVLEILENKIDELTKKLEQIKAEHQNLICDFMDYINDCVQNPAPYCAFGGTCVLVDKHGWCRAGEHGCNGFVPKVRDDHENAG